jgi:hypothetical protein
MRLFVFDLQTSGTLRQQITPTRNIDMVAIRPHIYKSLSPGGTLTINIEDQHFNTLKSSNAVTISTISAENYFHGVVRFDIEYPLRKGLTYNVTLTAGGGYTFSASDNIAWVNDYDLRKVPTSYSNDTGFGGALLMEIWERREITKGTY